MAKTITKTWQMKKVHGELQAKLKHALKLSKNYPIKSEVQSTVIYKIVDLLDNYSTQILELELEGATSPIKG